ncbi:MAG: radical SAM protein [Nitrospirae bacterium]|nr:MAG: radical SAM protein [Nitrospirota bacterium]
METAATPAEGRIAYPIRGALYLNLTNACTLRCRFCPKHQGSWVVGGHPLELARGPAFEEVVAAVGDPRPYREVVFCGLGEPTLRLGLLLRVADWLKGQGVARVRLNTDGLANLVHGRDVTPELAGRIDAVSVSLNAQDEATYVRHCAPPLPGAYAACKAFIRAATAHVPEVVATALEGLPGVDVEACRRIAEGLGARYRRRTYGKVG